MKIGNIADLSPEVAQRIAPSFTPRAAPKRTGLGRGLGLGQRFNQLTTTALDRGQKIAAEEIKELLPDPGSLEPQLDEKKAEVALSGIEAAMGVVGQLRGANARKAREALEGVYEAIAGEGAAAGFASGRIGHSATHDGGTDIIGLEAPGAGGLADHADSEWR